MKRFRNRLFAVMAICLTSGLILSVVAPVSVHAADKDKEEGQRLWLAGSDSVGGPDNVLYTVPYGHIFVLTDIVVTRGSVLTESLLGANVYSNASNAPVDGVPFSVRFWIDADQPDAQAILNLATGAVFSGGESILIGTAHHGVAPGGSVLDYRVGGMLYEIGGNDDFLIFPGG